MLLQNLQTELVELILNEGMSSDSIFPSQHMDIYCQHINANLIKTLTDIYPLIIHIVEQDYFRLLATEYIKRYPSRSGNLHDFGEYFSDFLAEYDPVNHLIYLSEVAKFEWINHLLYFAHDHAESNFTLLERISSDQYDQLHFTLHPASFLKKFHYPILRIVDLCKNEMDTPVNVHEGGVDLLMIKRDFNVILLSLLPAEFVFLKTLSENKSLSQALQKTMDTEQDFNLAEKLPVWIKEKIIVSCYLG